MNSFKPGLYIVSTPIGNLDDITLRALNVLKKSDVILCEDTRRSLKLLNHFNIKKKLVSYHKFNEKKELHRIIEYLNEGKILSLISDAGTPVLSDPGGTLINECIKRGKSIYPVPGPSSITASISISGFLDQFLFYGFLPKKEKELEKVLSGLRDLKFSIIFFIPGLKVNFYLKKFKEFFTNRNILIAREITKMHETFYRNSIKEISLFKKAPKGELTIVLSPANTKDQNSNTADINTQAFKYLKKYSLKDVVDLISKKEKISKKIVYEICLKIKNNDKIK